MKYLTVALFCFILASSVPGVMGKTIFQDNFSKDTGLWDFGPSWAIKDGVLMHTIEESWVFATPKNWNKSAINYTIELKAKKTGGAEGFGIFFGITQENPLKSGNDRNTLYQWVIGGWTNTRAQLARFVKGVRTDLVEIQQGAVLKLDEWHKLGIEMGNEQVRCYFDDEKVADVAQDPATIDGLFALGAYGPAAFDDVVVYFGTYGNPMSVKPMECLTATWGNLKSSD